MNVNENVNEMTRRILPWYLLPRFNNTILKVSIKDEKAILKRNIELYTTSNMPYAFIPVASLLLYIPYIKPEYSVNKVDKKKNEITINKIDGFISGYLPDGRYTKITGETIGKDIVGNEISIRGDPRDFPIGMVARRLSRIIAGKYFANKVKYYLKNKGWFFDIKGVGNIKLITIKEGNAITNIEIPTTFFEVRYHNKTIVSPGIIPGVSYFFLDNNDLPIESEPVKENLINFVNRIADIGKSFSSISILQNATKSSFGYAIGEANFSDDIKNTLKNESKNKYWYWLGGVPTYRGVRNNFYVDIESKKLIMTISFTPPSPPASLVLNYPPFHLLPLSAMAKERIKQLRIVANKIMKPRLKKIGVDGTFYIDEIEPLADANVKFDDIKKILKEGYPKIETLDMLLEKMDKISYIGDITSMAYGEMRKINEIMISTIKSKEEKKDEEEYKRSKKVKKRKSVSISL